MTAPLSPLDLIVCLLVVIVVVGLLVALTIDEPPGGADEGYLWYGVREVAAGRMPVRDFRSYEPGRYWWSVVFYRILGTGLWSMRIAATAFLTLGLIGTMLMVKGAGHSWIVLVVGAVCTSVWSLFPFKRFDQAILLAVMASVTGLLIDPSPISVTLVGVVAGAAAVFGLNLGLYATVTACLAFLVSVRGPSLDIEHVGLLAVGVLAGSAPLLVAMVAVSGFAAAMWRRRVTDVVQRGSTNLPLPFPVPWRSAPRQIGNVAGPAGSLILGWMFLLIPLAALSVTALALFGPLEWVDDHPVEIAAGLTTVVAWHHVMSRADLSHLATVVPVPIIGFLAALDSGVIASSVGAGVVIAISIIVVVPRHHRMQRHRRPSDFVRHRIGPRSSLWFRRGDAAQLDAVSRLLTETDPESPILAIPMSLWLLPFVGRRSAVYETFCVYPASVEAQRRMIAEIEVTRPPLAIVGVGGLDGRDDLRFPQTHPDVWAHIEAAYEAIDVIEPVPRVIRLLRRRGEHPRVAEQ